MWRYVERGMLRVGCQSQVSAAVVLQFSLPKSAKIEMWSACYVYLFICIKHGG